MPSYRPQAKIRRGSAASSCAIAWVNGSPAGVGTTSRGAGPRPGRARPAPHPTAPGRITMPGPPPYGVSSTVRCTSWVQVRRSCTATVEQPGGAGPADQRTGRAGRSTPGRSRRCRPASAATPTGRAGRRAGRPPPGRPARSTSGTIALTNGISAVRPSGRRSTSRSEAGAWSMRPPRRATSPAGVTTASPTSWWSWNSSGSSGGGHVARCPRRAASPRSASARLRSYTPSKLTSSRPWCRRAASTVSRSGPGPAPAHWRHGAHPPGRCAAPTRRRTAPPARRSAPPR